MTILTKHPTAREIAQRFTHQERAEALAAYRNMVDQLASGKPLRHEQRERLQTIGQCLMFPAAACIDGDARRAVKHRRAVEGSDKAGPDHKALNKRMAELDQREADLRQKLRAIQTERAELKQTGKELAQADWQRRTLEKDFAHLFSNADEWLAKLDAELADEATPPLVGGG